MNPPTQETSTENRPSTTSSEVQADELVLVYETYYKLFEWRRRPEVFALRRNGALILQISISWGSDKVSITVPWCLQNTYDDDDDDDGYDDGDCNLEEDEKEEVEVPLSVWETENVTLGGMKVLYVAKGHD
ncbi:hypothetical protein ACEPPN_010770 [Leptodophora sp. 'Broadleaf-Isolate-01']